MSLVDSMVFQAVRNGKGLENPSRGVVRLGASIVADWEVIEMGMVRLRSGPRFDAVFRSKALARAALRTDLLRRNEDLERMDACQDRLERDSSPAGRSLLKIMCRLDDRRDAEGFTLSLERSRSGAYKVDRIRRTAGPAVAANAAMAGDMQDLVEALPLSLLDAAWGARPPGTNRAVLSLRFEARGPRIVAGGRDWRLTDPDAPEPEDDGDEPR